MVRSSLRNPLTAAFRCAAAAEGRLRGAGDSDMAGPHNSGVHPGSVLLLEGWWPAVDFKSSSHFLMSLMPEVFLLEAAQAKN